MQHELDEKNTETVVINLFLSINKPTIVNTVICFKLNL